MTVRALLITALLMSIVAAAAAFAGPAAAQTAVPRTPPVKMRPATPERMGLPRTFVGNSLWQTDRHAYADAPGTHVVHTVSNAGAVDPATGEHRSIWRRGWEQHRDGYELDLDVFRAYARSLPRGGPLYVVLNLREDHPDAYYDPVGWEQWARWHRVPLRIVKEERPDALVGVYAFPTLGYDDAWYLGFHRRAAAGESDGVGPDGMPSLRGMNRLWWLGVPANDPGGVGLARELARLERYNVGRDDRGRNLRTEGLLDLCDVAVVQCYPLDREADSPWALATDRAATLEKVAVARRLGKPVLCYVSDRAWRSADAAQDAGVVSDARWENLLDACADGGATAAVWWASEPTDLRHPGRFGAATRRFGSLPVDAPAR